MSLSIRPSVCVCLSVHLSVCLFVCLFVGVSAFVLHNNKPASFHSLLTASGNVMHTATINTRLSG